MRALTNENLTAKTIAQLSYLISMDWDKVHPYAFPYLEAMSSLQSITDTYYSDSGTSIVSYFLSNASTYRGDNAKLIKTELRRRLKEVEQK